VALDSVLSMLDEAGAEADIRPALALLAAGGDPHRELELEGRAVSALAAELDRPERRAEVSRGLEALHGNAVGLAKVSPALEALLLDAGLAWRAYACALLADEL
jgi:hypothetical protein